MSIYKYSITSTPNAKSIKKDVSELPFVTGCKIKNGEIIVSCYDESSEGSVFSNIKEIALNYGATVTQGQQAAVASDGEKIQKPANKSIIDENLQETPSSDLNKDEVVGEEVDFETKLAERKKTFKKDLITRCVELSISLILLVAAFFIPSSQVFGVATVLNIASFAISGYDIFYEIIKAITKKRLFSTEYVILVLLISATIFFGLEAAAVLSFAYALFVATKQFLSDLNAIEVFAQFGNDGESVFEKRCQNLIKDKKVFKIIYIMSAVLALCSLLFLIPALKVYNDAVVIVAVAALLLAVSEDIYQFAISYKLSKMTLSGIEFDDINAIYKVAKGNAFEIKASVLTSGGEVRQDSIGAMKELVLLKAKSLKTDFDITLSDELKSQIDFMDKDFKGKNVLTVGDGGDISFGEAKSVKIVGDDIKKLPLLYKLAKKLKMAKTVLYGGYLLLAVLAVCSYLLCGILEMPFYSIVVGSLGYVLASLYLIWTRFDN